MHAFKSCLTATVLLAGPGAALAQPAPLGVTDGVFIMGSDTGAADEQPVHAVQVATFGIDRYEVTNGRYGACVDAGVCTPPALTISRDRPSYFRDARFADYPVVFVSWAQADTFCRFDGGRLPTEAEWEKTARGPAPSIRAYPWGDTPADCEHANMEGCLGDTDAVGRRPAGVSPYGAFDMAGNVYEWVQDEFLPYEGSSASAEVFVGKVAHVQNTEDRTMRVSDQVEVGGRYKVLRGGCWKCDPFSTTTYHRNYNWANYASDFFGFRCATDASGPVVAKP
jgi:gamma-glutamyl hercynylcysteine S-oxide synthase